MNKYLQSNDKSNIATEKIFKRNQSFLKKSGRTYSMINLGKSNFFSESKISNFEKLKINLFMYNDMLLLVLR